jgi:hypothetical protein
MSLKRKFRRKLAKTSGATSPYPDAEIPDSFMAESAALGKIIGFREVKLNNQPTGLRKISAQLIDFLGAAPLRELLPQARELAVNLGVLAWNLANLELDGREDEADLARKKFRKIVPNVAWGSIEALVERKKRMFPDDRRHVANVKVVEQDGSYILYASSIRPETIIP